ncbi:MAG: T9SS type A sorting domain-containing protein [Bacteroidia bacterium]|nr:T9SS type A sorting domain-containing protein [Bacteroidia bacterium]
MRRNLLYTLLILLSSFYNSFAQTNAVTLKDGAGTVIGSSNSITAAYAMIPVTLAQSYVIELNSNYDGSAETYPISFISKTGAGPSNTITLRPEASVVSVSITSVQASLPLIELNDADYIIIDGRPGGIGTDRALLISNMGTTTSSYGIEFIDGACNNVIRHCRISGYTTAGSGSKGIYIGASASNPTGNSDNRFEFLTFDNGPRYHMNSSGTQLNPNRNLVVHGCEFKNINFAGWWQQNGTGKVTVDSCFFYGTGGGGSSGTGMFAILSDFQIDTIVATRNSIYNMDNFNYSTDVMGMSFRSFNPGAAIRIFNNFINLNAANVSTGESYGISLGYNSANNPVDAMIYHNTILIGGTASGGTAGVDNSAGIAIIELDTLSKLDVRNNILINQRTGGPGEHLALSRIATLGTQVLNYNNYVSSGPNMVRLAGVTYPNLVSYQAAAGSNEINSKSVAVTFMSANDLHLGVPSATDINLHAVSIPAITHDYDGDLRISFYMGADEPNAGVGIDNLESSATTFELYPNPAGNSFTIRPLIQDVKYAELFDLNGAIVQKIELLPGTEKLVDVSQLSKGVYFVKLHSEKQVQSARLVVMD